MKIGPVPCFSSVAVCLTAWCLGSCHAQTTAASGGFGELLRIVGLGPDVLNQLDINELTDSDWQVLSQTSGRLEQHAADLQRWSLPQSSLSPESVGELLRIAGTVTRVKELEAPSATADGLGLTRLYRCQVETATTSLTVLSVEIPQRWDLTAPINEPVKLTAVLLSADEPLLLTTHLSWYPTGGVSMGQELLARQGMDAALWEQIVQRTGFITPEKGREAEAFYAALAALKGISARELDEHVTEQILESAANKSADPHIAAVAAEQAESGLSSVVPLFLHPDRHVGELLRLEGTARRAVRVSVAEGENPTLDEPIREYFELEVFTPDSQNYPVVCCVTRLPAGFPLGDAIRTGVRVDGVFFKLWRYRSRELVEGRGETATQKSSYTPIILGGTVTWLQQAPAARSWWGIVVGVFVFAVIMIALARVLLSSQDRRRRRLPDVLPNHFGGEP